MARCGAAGRRPALGSVPMASDEQGMSDRLTGRPVAGETAGGTSWSPAAPRGSAGGDGQAGGAGSGMDPEASDKGRADTEAGTERRNRSFWRELPILIVIALVIALLIKTFVVQAFFIPSSSMEDTLLIGDKVLVNKIVYHFRSIQPGDIIVFNGAGSWNPVPAPVPSSSDPVVRAYDATLKPLFHSIAGIFGTDPGQTYFIKRVIGVPGDRVACCNAHGLVTVNGVPLHEQSYLYPGAAPSTLRFSITVPPGRLWVMGDNRGVSDDSRLRQDDPGRGTVPENEVAGRAFMIVWPPSRWRFLPIPSTFDQPGVSAHAAAAAAADNGTVQLRPAAPYLPVAGGLAGAVPLTLLQRRLRRRRAPRRR